MQYFANDYDIRRIYLGPLEGRPQELIPLLSGLMLNPNCEYAANFVSAISLSHWKTTSTPYNAASAAAAGAEQWLPFFEPKPTSALATIPPISLEDVKLLIDCFYLPYQHGSRALAYKSALLELLSAAASGALRSEDTRVKSFVEETSKITTLFSKLTYIKNRDLLYLIAAALRILSDFSYFLSPDTPCILMCGS